MADIYSKSFDATKLDAETRAEIGDAVVAGLAKMAAAGVGSVDALHVRVGHIKIIDFTKIFTKVVSKAADDDE